VIENAQREIFPPVLEEGTTPSDEEDFDLIRAEQAKKGIANITFPADEVVVMVTVHKRL
jgi:hypothetical protein